MKRRFTVISFGLCVLILAVPVVQPLLGQRLTAGYDNVLHLWRALEVDALLDVGILYARWQPHMVFGYGYPMLLFNPPLSALLAVIFHRLGLGWAASVNGVFVVGTLFSGLTTWLLVREFWGEGAGLVAAVVMLTLPFHAYVNFHRASMSEALAWAFPGLILWGLYRWQKYGQRLGFVAVSGGLTAMLLTHDASTYLFLPLLIVAVVALALAHRSWRSRGVFSLPFFVRLGRGVLALALGIGMAAFFWLPSVLERGHVQFERVLDYPYAASFVALDYLLEPPRVADPSLLNPWLPKGIGLLPGILILLSPLAWWRAEREQRFWLGGIGLVTLGCVWLTTPYAWPIWRRIPLLRYLHFPWRFLSPAAIGLAILAGAGAYLISRFTLYVSRFMPYVSRFTFHVSLLLPSILIVALILGSLGWLYPPHTALPQPATIPGMLAYERTVGLLGGTTFGELLPRWVQRLPEEPLLDDDLSAGQEPVRLRPSDLPQGAHILRADYRPLRATIELKTPTAFRARYLAFYYPGWRVTVDGDPVDIAPTDPEGLIAFDIPPGRHTIHVRFGETPLRLVADAISIISLMAGILVCWYIGKSGNWEQPHQPTNLPIYQYISLLISILLLIAKFAVIDRGVTPLRRANLREGRLHQVDSPAQITFGDEFLLLGYDALPESVASGERFDVGTYWRALQPGGPDYGITVHVVGPQGRGWEGSNIRPARWHRSPPPVGEWSPDQYADVGLSVPLLPATPPGAYTVEVVAFERGTLAPLAAHAAAGQSLGLAVPLGQIQVTRPQHSPATDELSTQRGSEAFFGPLRLIGYSLDREEAAPGDPFSLTFLWQAHEVPEEDLMARLCLLNAESEAVASFDLPPVRDDFPTGRWLAGEIWRGQHHLRLPARLQNGEHRWTLQVCRMNGTQCQPVGQEITLGTLQVDAPDRLWEVPVLDVEVNTRLGDTGTLLGANLKPETLKPGVTLTVTLVWRAEAEMETSYRVFLHLLAPDGTLAAQSDGEPANWNRPTTGWLPGEYITDVHTLTLPNDAPSGEYTLSAGLYIPDGERLTAPDGVDAVPLITSIVERYE